MCVFKKQDPEPDLVFKILICRIWIRPKMDRIRNPATTNLGELLLDAVVGALDEHVVQAGPP